MNSHNGSATSPIAEQNHISWGLGTTYLGHDPALLDLILPFVEYIETTPDSIAQISGDQVVLHDQSIAELQSIGNAAKIIVHGIGLSIGSYDGYSQRYIRLLDDLMDRVNVAWHSEHLGYTIVNGENTGTMLAMPRTEQALDMLCERIRTIQERYRVPFLLENIIHMLPDYPGDYSEAGFLNTLTERTDCGLILDIYNLECDQHNNGFDIPTFLAEIDLSKVQELHVACGTEYHGFLLDAHSKTTRDSTVKLAEDTVKLAAGAVKVVTYELLREAVPALGHGTIVNELRRLRMVFCN
jgi:uncharacterized protein